MLPFIYLDGEIFIEFSVLTEMINSMSRSSIYRRIVNSFQRRTYKNRKLIRYRDLLEHPVLSKEVRKHEIHQIF
jgi:hypothetical protein